MYVDELDGRIEAHFFDQKQAEWRDEQIGWWIRLPSIINPMKAKSQREACS